MEVIKSDGEIFGASELKKRNDGTFKTIFCPVMTETPTRSFILKDDAFALRAFLVKPYTRRGLSEIGIIQMKLLHKPNKCSDHFI